MKVIIARAFANGEPCPFADQYLASMDFEAYGGQGFAAYTKDPAKALRFADTAAALAFWNTVPTVRPIRPDGRPNKPLTSTTVEICDVEDAWKPGP